MRQPLKKASLLLLLLILAGAVLGCKNFGTAAPTLTPTPTIPLTATHTLTPSLTHTSTLAPTITPLPSKTPTVTRTPFSTLSPTPSPSPVPSQPALLFPYQDTFGRVVDWSYTRVTQRGENLDGELNELWAFMAFQLLDRGIHQRNLEFLGETITVYYLNVAHEFDGVLLPMQLVLGGTTGENVPIDTIPAGGTAYIQVLLKGSTDPFHPYRIHDEAKLPFEDRQDATPLVFIKDVQALLPTLPDELILIAEHPILIPSEQWPQVKLDMSRVSYLAARYQPFFELDPYDRIEDQSAFAYALRDYILFQRPMPEGLYAFSSQTLVIVQGE